MPLNNTVVYMAMPCAISFERDQIFTYRCLCMMQMCGISKKKKRSFEHARQSVERGEIFWADGCDPRQSISQSVIPEPSLSWKGEIGDAEGCLRMQETHRRVSVWYGVVNKKQIHYQKLYYKCVFLIGVGYCFCTATTPEFLHRCET